MSSLEAASPFDKARPDDGLSSFDQRVAATLEKPIVQILLLNAFKEYMVQHLALNQPPIPIGQVIGFSQFTANYAEVLTEQTTASVTYADLATTGPSLTGLPNGQYVVLYGAFMAGSVTSSIYMSVDVNGAGAADADYARVAVDSADIGASANRAVIKTLSANSNTITAKYRVSAGTGSFINRYLIALRYASA